MTTTDAVKYDLTDGIVTLTLDDPNQSANTMNEAYRSSMAAAVRQLRRRGQPARQAVALHVPGLRGAGVRLDPRLGRRDELVAGGDDLVDQA
ncbi:MAG TPA: hypothetical protein VK948_00200, partial [Aeromicrobium sp.]|nr:hypothetical protein [Aeromicrobium sp.]